MLSQAKTRTELPAGHLTKGKQCLLNSCFKLAALNCFLLSKKLSLLDCVVLKKTAAGIFLQLMVCFAPAFVPGLSHFNGK